MKVAGLIRCFEILQNGDISHRVLTGKGLVLHLHVGLLGRLAHYARDIILVARELINKVVDLVVDGIAEEFVHCSDGCSTSNF